MMSRTGFRRFCREIKEIKMVFRYLGTAAAEGSPAYFCGCDNCKKARLIGGRAVRSRPQAIVDGRLLIDFGADTLTHIQRFGIDSTNIRSCVITHAHSDHFYPVDLEMILPGFANPPEGWRLDFFGSKEVRERAVTERGPQTLERLTKLGRVTFTEVKAYEPFRTQNYTITPLTGLHDPKAGPLIYIISDGDKTILYAHDTHFFPDEVWDFLAEMKPRFDMVSLDCCNALTPLDYIGHMSLTENIEVRRRFLAEGFADEKTRFIANHFSHNGKCSVYDDFLKPANDGGFEVSYDGMIIEL